MSTAPKHLLGRYGLRRYVFSRYGPFVAIATALGLLVALAPTTTPAPRNIFAGYQPGTGASAPGPSPEGPGSRGSGSRGSAGGGSQVPPSADLAARNRSARPDCSRQAILGTLVPCKPRWAGNNGGSTYKGVTRNQINLLYYEANLGSQINAAAETAGLSPPAVQDHEIDVYTQFFNKYFQTYGRRVNVIHFHSPFQIQDQSALRANAVSADQQYHAFLAVGGASPDYLDEAARRGIVTISGIQMPQSFYAAHTPFVFGILPSTDTNVAMVADYIVKKLGRNNVARFGGDDSSPRVNGIIRRYGIIYPTTNQDGSPSIYDRIGDQLQHRLDLAGIPTAVKIGYSLDINASESGATNVVQQLRQARVTTVLCMCDPIAPIFFSNAATHQGYFPEYLQTGFLFEDVDQVGRLYDQAQWKHDFGVSSLPVQQNLRDTTTWRAWRAIEPSTDPPIDAQLVFAQFLLTFAGLEATGPEVNPRSFADGMFSLRLESTSPEEPTFFYSRNDYGGIKDAQEVWWDSTAPGPDGKVGTYRSVDGGYRYTIEHLPTAPTRVFDLGCVAPRSCGAPWFN